MDGLLETRRHRTFRRLNSILFRVLVAVAIFSAAASCSAGTGPGPTGPASTAPPTDTAPAGPVTAEISQFRDNYSKHIIEIQLTNTTDARLTVLSATLTSPLFAAAIEWPAPTGGIELPPGQAKSLPAPLPDPACGTPAQAQTGPATDSGGDAGKAVVSLRMARPEGSPAAQAGATAPVADPFGVLARNNSELCLARAAAAVATIVLAPELDVAADGRTAVVHLLMTPRAASGPAAAGAGEMVIEGVDETTLLAEAAQRPWPHSVTLRAGEQPSEVLLGIRPARCDPHAVAEDKVGTLLPLRVSAAGRQGVLKIHAGDQLRARIYDFVTTSCGRQ